ncbi:hypothetical protein NECAME_13888 [Necator americanus]|uniref:Uncharacterized protein n=1 Tax=Necator americanus TaxID=51031 RepID=W2SUM2_NECAM|nr:hypothetical protein NECAME_13888 [Necator americanus]ETN72397.1 hypothetical protein NECAME_13888 [Necator americanus]
MEPPRKWPGFFRLQTRTISSPAPDSRQCYVYACWRHRRQTNENESAQNRYAIIDTITHPKYGSRKAAPTYAFLKR